MNPKYKITININEIVFAIILALFLTPGYLQTIPLIHRASQVIGIIMAAWFLYRYLQRPHHFKGFILVSLFYITILYSTISNKGESLQFLILTIVGIGFFSFVLYSSNSEKTFDDMLVAFIVVLEAFVILNLITIFLAPDGLYRIYGYHFNTGSNPAYFLGHRNNAIEYFLPLIGLVCIKNKIEGKLWSPNLIIVLVISSFTSLLTWSANEIICMAFVVLSLIIHNKKGIPGYSILLFFIASAVASFVIIFMGVNPFFQKILTNVLRKTATMSGRTRIWSLALVTIAQAFVFGHGIQSNYYNYVRISTVGSCHNYFLDYLYLGGVVCFTIVILYVLYLYRNIKGIDKDLYSLFSMFYGAYFILWIASPVHKETIFIMLAFFIIPVIAAKRIANKNEKGKVAFAERRDEK